MIIGINTNIQHKGETYHVQTEDGGLDQHTLTTILFKNGAILSSKKSSYLDISKSDEYEDTVKELMREQHKQMLRELVSGRVELKAKQPQELKTEVIEKRHSQSAFPQNEVLDRLIFEYLAKKDAVHA